MYPTTDPCLALHNAFLKEGHFRAVYSRRYDHRVLVPNWLPLHFTPRDLRLAARNTQCNDELFYDSAKKAYWYWGDDN